MGTYESIEKDFNSVAESWYQSRSRPLVEELKKWATWDVMEVGGADALHVEIVGNREYAEQSAAFHRKETGREWIVVPHNSAARILEAHRE
jgi:hypothetical protein